MYFAESQADQLLGLCKIFTKTYTVCNKYARDKGYLPIYHFVPKFHLLMHIAINAKWLSPRASWCYEWEAFAKTIIRAARACTAATNVNAVPTKVMENYCLSLSLDLFYQGKV